MFGIIATWHPLLDMLLYKKSFSASWYNQSFILYHAKLHNNISVLVFNQHCGHAGQDPSNVGYNYALDYLLKALSNRLSAIVFLLLLWSLLLMKHIKTLIPLNYDQSISTMQSMNYLWLGYPRINQVWFHFHFHFHPQIIQVVRFCRLAYFSSEEGES